MGLGWDPKEKKMESSPKIIMYQTVLVSVTSMRDISVWRGDCEKNDALFVNSRNIHKNPHRIDCVSRFRSDELAMASGDMVAIYNINSGARTSLMRRYMEGIRGIDDITKTVVLSHPMDVKVQNMSCGGNKYDTYGAPLVAAYDDSVVVIWNPDKGVACYRSSYDKGPRGIQVLSIWSNVYMTLGRDLSITDHNKVRTNTLALGLGALNWWHLRKCGDNLISMCKGSKSCAFDLREKIDPDHPIYTHILESPILVVSQSSGPDWMSGSNGYVNQAFATSDKMYYLSGGNTIKEIAWIRMGGILSVNIIPGGKRVTGFIGCKSGLYMHVCSRPPKRIKISQMEPVSHVCVMMNRGGYGYREVCLKTLPQNEDMEFLDSLREHRKKSEFVKLIGSDGVSIDVDRCLLVNHSKSAGTLVKGKLPSVLRIAMPLSDSVVELVLRFVLCGTYGTYKNGLPTPSIFKLVCSILNTLGMNKLESCMYLGFSFTSLSSMEKILCSVQEIKLLFGMDDSNALTPEIIRFRAKKLSNFARAAIANIRWNMNISSTKDRKQIEARCISHKVAGVLTSLFKPIHDDFRREFPYSKSDIEFGITRHYWKTLEVLYKTRRHANITLETEDGGLEEVHISVLISHGGMFPLSLRFDGQERKRWIKEKKYRVEDITSSTLACLISCYYMRTIHEEYERGLTTMFQLLNHGIMYKDRVIIYLARRAIIQFITTSNGIEVKLAYFECISSGILKNIGRHWSHWFWNLCVTKFNAI